MVITGRRPIAGISDNVDNSPTDLVITWYTPAGVLVTVTGQIVPISGSLQHSADIRVIKDNRGNEVSVLYSNEKVTIELAGVPLGAAGTGQLDEAVSAAQFPSPGGWMTIASGPAGLVMGGFSSNVLNADNWQYNVDGRVEMASEGEWGLRWSCTRRINLAKSAAVTV